MPREQRQLKEATSELVRTLVETGILNRRQAKELEPLLTAGKQEKAGKLLGKFLDIKGKGRSSKD
jgi:polyhydroxyalkanoate synthesis regulator phasin